MKDLDKRLMGPTRKLKNFWAGGWNDSHIPDDLVKDKKMRTLDEMLQPGQKVKVFYGEGNINNEIRHIRAIVDGKFIVYRIWRNHKQDWFYKVESRYSFEYIHEEGILT